MNVDDDDIDDETEHVDVVRENVDEFGDHDRVVIADLLKDGFDGGDERCELGGGVVLIEDGLVADDNHFDDDLVPVDSGGDVVNLNLNIADAAFGDVDA